MSQTPGFQWRDEFAVGIKVIDEEHRELVAMIDALYRAIEAPEAIQHAALDGTLQGLLRYVTNHFLVEEEMMRVTHFPGYAKHKEVHDSLAKKVRDLFQQFENGELVMVVPVVNLLKKWLENHILKVDREMAEYLVQQGI